MSTDDSSLPNDLEQLKAIIANQSAVLAMREQIDRTHPPQLPSDFAGITAAIFAPHSSGNLAAALGAACALIEKAVVKQGARDMQKLRRLSEVEASVEGAKSKM